MSLKTHENQAYAVLYTFDREEVFLTEDEYTVYRVVTQNPNAKFLTFDDGSIAIADIRRVKVLPQRISESMQLEAGSSPEDDRPLTEEQKKKIEEHRKMVIERSKMVARGVLGWKPQPKVPQKSPEEFERLRKIALQQAERILSNGR